MKTTEIRNIKADLIRLGILQGEIADSLGITISSVCDVIHFRRSTPRIREEIARRLGKSVAEIWPEVKPQDEVKV